MENQTTEEKLTAKFEAFKEETKRMGRAYWASVRRADQQVQEIRQSYTPVYECPVCGLFRPAEHTQQCRDLRPVDLSMSEENPLEGSWN
jgi:rubrerythrin